MAKAPAKTWKTVKVDFEDGIAWVTLNRPEKRNALSPTVNREMIEVLDVLETDDRCKILVLTGAGDSFCAGMDLKEYFRETDGSSAIEIARIKRDSMGWQWRRLAYYTKPTIAMVNGWCFGGAFTPLVGCDLAIAADEATFGLSEINWGIIPAGNVTKAVADKMSQSDALYYLMSGETFDGKKAAQMRLVNESVPREQLRARVTELCKNLMEKNLHVMSAIKIAYRRVKEMNWDLSEDYLYAKSEQVFATDKEHGRKQGLEQFLDEKSFRPGLGSYKPKT